MIIFTKYALNKFEILNRHNCIITKNEVLNVLSKPIKIDINRAPILIAEGISDNQTIKVVYKEDLAVKNVLTFYPVCVKKE